MAVIKRKALARSGVLSLTRCLGAALRRLRRWYSHMKESVTSGFQPGDGDGA
jgi:hypothetical protein